MALLPDIVFSIKGQQRPGAKELGGMATDGGVMQVDGCIVDWFREWGMFAVSAQTKHKMQMNQSLRTAAWFRVDGRHRAPSNPPRCS